MQADDLVRLDQLIDAYKAQLKRTDLLSSASESAAKAVKREIKKSIFPKLTPEQVRGLNGWLTLIEAQANRYEDGSKPSSDFDREYFCLIERKISQLICDPEIILVILQSEYRKDQTISAAILKCNKSFRSSFDPLVICNVLQEIEEQAQIIALGMIAPALTNCYGIALEQQFVLMSRAKLIDFSCGFFSTDMTQWIEALWAFINMCRMTSSRSNRIVANAMRILQRVEQARFSVLTILHAKNGLPPTPPIIEKSRFQLSSSRTYSSLSLKEKRHIEEAVTNEFKRDLLYRNNISMHVQQKSAGNDTLIEKTAALTIVYHCLGKPILNAFEALSLALGYFSFNAASFAFHLNFIEEYANNIFATAKMQGSFYAPLGECATPYIVVLQSLLCKLTKQELEKFADKIYQPNCEGFYRALWATVYDNQKLLPPNDELRFDNHIRGRITRSIIQFELLRETLDLILMMRGLQPKNLLENKKLRQFSDINKNAIPERHLALVREIIAYWKTIFDVTQDRRIDSEKYSSQNCL